MRPMLVILFRSKLTATAGDDYGAMAQAMANHAKTCQGFVRHEGLQSRRR